MRLAEQGSAKPLGGFTMLERTDYVRVTLPHFAAPIRHPARYSDAILQTMARYLRAGWLVLDPFAGAGTTAVTAKKLKRHFISIEIDKTYCCLAEKRLKMAETDSSIQGYINGYFWERNTLSEQKRNIKMSKI